MKCLDALLKELGAAKFPNMGSETLGETRLKLTQNNREPKKVIYSQASTSLEVYDEAS